MEFTFFRRGLTAKKNCDTLAVLGMLKQNFSFLASYVIVIWMFKGEAIQMMYYIVSD